MCGISGKISLKEKMSKEKELLLINKSLVNNLPELLIEENFYQ